MTDQEFRVKMIEGMAELRTSMKQLVGEDGSGGIIAKHSDDIDDLKLSRARDRGIAAGISVAVSVTVTIFKALVFGR